MEKSGFNSRGGWGPESQAKAEAEAFAEVLNTADVATRRDLKELEVTLLPKLIH
jgi:hypothetical protein